MKNYRQTSKLRNMRKFLLFCLSLFVGTTVGYAQDDDVNHAFEFVTNDGVVIPHGSVYVIDKVVTEEDPETGETFPMLPSDFVIKNVSGTATDLVRIANEITRIDNGSYSTCAMGACLAGRTEPEYFSSSAGTIEPGATSGDLQTEWYPDTYGECDVDLQIEIGENAGFGQFGFLDFGPLITVKFVYYDFSRVDEGISGAPARIVGRYTLDGQAVNYLQHGVYILRMSDGTSRKVVVR